LYADEEALDELRRRKVQEKACSVTSSPAHAAEPQRPPFYEEEICDSWADQSCKAGPANAPPGFISPQAELEARPVRRKRPWVHFRYE